jgi:hypothetical protein
LFRAAIIAALLALLGGLGGCSMLRLGYGQADALAFRWIDGYVDLDDAQSLKVREGLHAWFAWHRRTQLDAYADLLLRIEAEIRNDTTAERLCGWWGEARTRFDAALEQAAPVIAEVAMTLKPAQIENVQRRYAKSNQEFRDEYLQADPQRRAREYVKRTAARAETLYDDVDDAQRAQIAQWLLGSPFDPRVAFEERQRRQQDTLQLLRHLSGGRIDADAALAEVRAWAWRIDRSPREPYRRYAERLVQANCRLAADIHNATRPGQREEASKRLRGWAADLRALAAEGRS